MTRDRKDKMRNYLLILLVGLGALSANSCTTSATSAGVVSTGLQETTVAKNVNAVEFKSGINTKKEVIVLDVRTPREVAQGFIPGAVNVDYSSSNFKSDLNKFDKTKPIYVYCTSGVRSANTLRLLQEMGFAEVYNLNGGIIAWAQAGLTIEK